MSLDKKLEDYNYVLQGMRHDPAEPVMHLLLRRIDGTTEEFYDNCVYEFEAHGQSLRVSELIRRDGTDEHSDYEGRLPRNSPQGIVIFSEVLNFVKETLAPTRGDRIGEAQIRYVMDLSSCSREEAIDSIRINREEMENERTAPDFGYLPMLNLQAIDKSCTWGMECDSEGNWTVKVNTPNPRDRFISEKGLFSQVAMDVIVHLNALPKR